MKNFLIVGILFISTIAPQLGKTAPVIQASRAYFLSIPPLIPLDPSADKNQAEALLKIWAKLFEADAFAHTQRAMLAYADALEAWSRNLKQPEHQALLDTVSQMRNDLKTAYDDHSSYEKVVSQYHALLSQLNQHDPNSIAPSFLEASDQYKQSVTQKSSSSLDHYKTLTARYVDQLSRVKAPEKAVESAKKYLEALDKADWNQAESNFISLLKVENPSDEKLTEKLVVQLSDLNTHHQEESSDAPCDFNKTPMAGEDLSIRLAVEDTPAVQPGDNMFPLGSAFITDSGNLKNQGVKAVIHAASGSSAKGVLGGRYEPSLDSVAASVKNSLLLAHKNGLKSITIPFIGGKIFAQRIFGHDPSPSEYQKLADTIVRAALENAHGIQIDFMAANDSLQSNTEASLGTKNATAKSFIQSLSKLKQGNPVFSSVQTRVIEGDITRQRTEAVVNAANTEGKFGGGISGAIANAAGIPHATEIDPSGPRE